ncbi:hypothetical protein GQ457_03G023260 [Hibiscus cannabinus]
MRLLIGRSIGVKTNGRCEFWSPPPLGFMKLNVDGAMKCDCSSGGIGGAIRNSNGALIASFSDSISSGLPILAKLLALKFGLLLFGSQSECKLSRLIVECDCKIALGWISNPCLCPSPYKSFVKEIVSLGTARSSIFRWIPRNITLEADTLAKEGMNIRSVEFYLTFIPRDVCYIE